MKISRRQFVESTAMVTGGLCLPVAIGELGSGKWDPGTGIRRRESGTRLGSADSRKEGKWTVLDLEEECALPESLQGYSAVFGMQSVCSADELAGQKYSRFVIVPGVRTMPKETAMILRERLDAGGTLILESGAGFCKPRESAAHQRMLDRSFAVLAGEPVDLWRENGRIPYVDYSWPDNLMVRDFSRVVPVAVPEVEVIGRVAELPVAAKRRVGNGMLVFLGSPLGPALRAGDIAAAMWLKKIA